MDLTRTSKYLSLILRHKPEVAGISLDEHGCMYICPATRKLRARLAVGMGNQ